jgi:hypothetical protein
MQGYNSTQLNWRDRNDPIAGVTMKAQLFSISDITIRCFTWEIVQRA